MLLAFLANRDVHCPRCDYNLRNLTRPVCPECREQLRLTVGARRAQFGWLILALGPGIFSGIAAMLFAFPLLVIPIVHPGLKLPPWPIYAMDGFGWLSALSALLLFVFRYRFLRQPRSAQIAWAAAIWFIHIAVFIIIMFILI